MCLDHITKELKPFEVKMMTFYKEMDRVRRKGKKNLYFFTIMSKNKPITKGVVYKALSGQISGLTRRDPVCYDAGFHGYTNLRSAARLFRRVLDFYLRSRGNKKYRVVVKCRGLVHTIGIQNHTRVVVAKTLEILREVPLAKLKSLL